MAVQLAFQVRVNPCIAWTGLVALLAAMALGSVGVWGWQQGLMGSSGWIVIAILSLTAVLCILSMRVTRFEPLMLAFDGQCWFWQAAALADADQVLPVTARLAGKVSKCLDLGSAVVLYLKPLQSTNRGFWVFITAQSVEWHLLRCITTRGL